MTKERGRGDLSQLDFEEKQTKASSITPSYIRTDADLCDTPISYFQLFKFSTIWDQLLTAVSILFGIVAAAGFPFAIIAYGEFTALLVDRTSVNGTLTKTILLSKFGGGRVLTNATPEEKKNAILEDSNAFGIASFTIGLIEFLCLTIAMDLGNYSALRQVETIRKLFLRSVIRQDISWHDTFTGNNFAVQLTDNLNKIKDGIGEKLIFFIYILGLFTMTVVFSLFHGWKLTLVVLSCAPLVIFSTAFMVKLQSSLSEKGMEAYSSAGAVAEEVFNSIRTVLAFGGEEKELRRYQEKLTPAEKSGFKAGLVSGIGGGAMWFFIYCCYALIFWYGVSLIVEDRYEENKLYTPALLITVLSGVMIGSQNVGSALPHIETFAMARGAARTIFSIIIRQPLIDPLSQGGLKPSNIRGNINFENVLFNYPARNDVEVLRGFTLTAKAGQCVALVGPSGCGKSTCLQLLQRFYDPKSGVVRLDGNKITELNTNWLRSNIGVVGQEPVLFATTVGNNIRYGKPDCTQEEIIAAAKIANCHDFIMKLPEKYESMVGERGAQLSGGQKQRIAVARAIIRDPKILLLDEATSALDPVSEKKVQKALEKASEGRTTLVVSHRLSTITKSDKIVFIQNGIVQEEGTHYDLMQQRGLYYNLVKVSKSEEPESEEEPRRSKESRFASSSLEDDDLEKDLMPLASEMSEPDAATSEKYKVSIMRLFKLNGPEWKFIVIGCLAAIIHGATQPAFAVIFGEFYGIFSIDDPGIIWSESIRFVIYSLILGLIVGIATFLQTFLLNIAGCRLTTRLRKFTFKNILSQEMGYFDDQNNSVGALCARLSGDCADIHGATGTRLGAILQSISTVVIGVLVAFVFSWKLALVGLITMSLILETVVFEAYYTATGDAQEKQALEKASQIAVEAISNIRTIASLNQEKLVIKRYTKQTEACFHACRRKHRFRGVLFAFGHTVMVWAYGLVLWYGGMLVAQGELHYKDVIKVSEALVAGAWFLGQALSFTPSVNAGMKSAMRILKLLDRVPKLYNPPSVPFNVESKIRGNINYNNIYFRYPTRPHTPVLRALNLTIPKSRTFALVGPSGCGKSTCIQLLLRYYDADEGEINLDGVQTTNFPIEKLRSRLGLVSQEPVLFDKTIAENIAYGDNFREVSMVEIIKAAKDANIHDFITNLPLGYRTSLGAKGTQLSGGQKQRIAIARALIRNPRILLLDEATSSLDIQSEKVVQRALDTARKGRTCIIIAHRLTTIQNADAICVIEDGEIVETGTHRELLELGRKYAKLHAMQQIS
ncbi:multidrug resistance protein homolog 49-like isoform X2 [Hermetia illucens]|uniref:multidrug resistance protein homolog 49-like isoform X2 n=1 Tax=Hermetia illucens TaxID=343691 RepID=UPI0018CC4C20|nr:multidrug resistance protein homolog 49-like isoform X2 [Hermetia illucens]